MTMPPNFFFHLFLMKTPFVCQRSGANCDIRVIFFSFNIEFTVSPARFLDHKFV